MSNYELKPMRKRAFIVEIPEWSKYPLNATLIQQLIVDDSKILGYHLVKVKEIKIG